MDFSGDFEKVVQQTRRAITTERKALHISEGSTHIHNMYKVYIGSPHLHQVINERDFTLKIECASKQKGFFSVKSNKKQRRELKNKRLCFTSVRMARPSSQIAPKSYYRMALSDLYLPSFLRPPTQSCRSQSLIPLSPRGPSSSSSYSLSFILSSEQIRNTYNKFMCLI